MSNSLLEAVARTALTGTNGLSKEEVKLSHLRDDLRSMTKTMAMATSIDKVVEHVVQHSQKGGKRAFLKRYTKDQFLTQLAKISEEVRVNAMISLMHVTSSGMVHDFASLAVPCV
jgi:hypothetical protein